MLAALRAMNCRLGVLTNCYDDLFAQTQRAFQKPFDLVITAQQVKAYKPAHAHFHEFSRRTGVSAGDWVHVACSWFHDIVPTHELGVRSTWLDRENTGQDPALASIRVRTAAEVPAAVNRLFGAPHTP
jgi:2-haloacid dehalogenase